ncbi:MAG: hypothetical protein HY287_07230 [Planctomycetes bacterium]|nr:hypothetical protein [Planctomycetota bacterium]
MLRAKSKPVTFTKFTIFLAAYLQFGTYANAATIQTIGAGSAVTSIDRSATFGTLTSSNVVHLDTYSEGGLSITTSGDSWAADTDITWLTTFDPFHGANSPDRAFYSIAWGNEDWVTIKTTDSRKLFGVEFMYGNGWTMGQMPYPWGNNGGIVDWQSWNGDSMSYSGSVGGMQVLEMGTILGFYDPAGFDRMLVRCTHPQSGNPLLQVIALDNLNVQLSDCSGVNQCSGNGACVTTNTCSCNAGWTGPSCATATCTAVSNCFGHGVCVAPDTCQCGMQWIGPSCSTGPIPAVSTWGMAVLSLATLALGTLVMTRRIGEGRMSDASSIRIGF